MLSTTFATRTNLADASRLPAISRESKVSAAEIGLLLACGALSAIAVGMLHLRIGVPGHAILRGVVPMALGLALVPRRSSGMVMASGAGVTAALMLIGGFGRFQPAALLSVLLLGPVLDLALIGRPAGWRLYGRFVVAGVVANCAAFATRFAVAFLGYRLPGGRQFIEFWPTALGSFVVCGAVAGLVSASLWFRLSSRR
jgi:hypothetical protein